MGIKAIIFDQGTIDLPQAGAPCSLRTADRPDSLQSQSSTRLVPCFFESFFFYSAFPPMLLVLFIYMSMPDICLDVCALRRPMAGLV